MRTWQAGEGVDDGSDAWASWESRWADAFRKFDDAERLRQQQAQWLEEERRRRHLEEAERLREADAARQRERRGTRPQDRGPGPRPSKAPPSPPTTPPQRPGLRPPLSPPAAAAPGAAKAPEGPRFANAAAYEEAWSKFESRAKAGDSVTYFDIPWPLNLPSVSGASPSDATGERKKKLRSALLRWHPDKWAPLMDRVREADRALVTQQVKEVTRRIIGEKERFGG